LSNQGTVNPILSAKELDAEIQFNRSRRNSCARQGSRGELSPISTKKVQVDIQDMIKLLAKNLAVAVNPLADQFKMVKDLETSVGHQLSMLQNHIQCGANIDTDLKKVRRQLEGKSGDVVMNIMEKFQEDVEAIRVGIKTIHGALYNMGTIDRETRADSMRQGDSSRNGYEKDINIWIGNLAKMVRDELDQKVYDSLLRTPMTKNETDEKRWL